MLDAIGIISKNIDQTINFYKHFGLNFTQVGGPDHLECTLENGMRVMIDSEKLMKQINPHYVKPTGFGITLCFKQNTVEQVDELAKVLKSQNYKFTKEPWDAFWGQRYACLLDPDGNQVDIFADLKKD